MKGATKVSERNGGENVSLEKDTFKCPALVCFRQHNKIRSVEGSQLQAYLSLEVLDLSSNNITEIRNTCFPHGLHLKEL